MPNHPIASRALAVASLAIPIAAFADGGAATAFNPKISLILNGTFAHYSSDAPADMPGFLLGGESDFRPSGLSLGETELAVESNVDDLFHAWAAISIDEDDHVRVEEAYVNTLQLPEGFTLKLGRFFSDLGYQNHQHAHAWEFVDAPLVYRAFLGGQLGDDGAQVRWVAPLPVFLDAGIELFRGAAFPGGGDRRGGIPAKSVFVHLGDDLGPSWSYRIGASYFATNGENRRTGDPIETSFTGRTRMAGADVVFKWAPNGNPTQRNAVLQGEFYRRTEHGGVIFDPDGFADASAYDGRQWGFYVQGVYQFVPQWRAGVRYDRVHAHNTLDNPEGDSLALLADDMGRDPQRWSAMVDWSHSEFSRVRLQYNRDESRPNRVADNQVFLQYIFAIGSHPAHSF
ncbi:MAG TPA: TonB-dependent receptor [Nevskiaceae bacterium]|nr:TonB-dependent receptor [Nevskiaceae bacterium]